MPLACPYSINHLPNTAFLPGLPYRLSNHFLVLAIFFFLVFINHKYSLTYSVDQINLSPSTVLPHLPYQLFSLLATSLISFCLPVSCRFPHATLLSSRFLNFFFCLLSQGDVKLFLTLYSPSSSVFVPSFQNPTICLNSFIYSRIHPSNLSSIHSSFVHPTQSHYTYYLQPVSHIISFIFATAIDFHTIPARIDNQMKTKKRKNALSGM